MGTSGALKLASRETGRAVLWSVPSLARTDTSRQRDQSRGFRRQERPPPQKKRSSFSRERHRKRRFWPFCFRWFRAEPSMMRRIQHGAGLARVGRVQKKTNSPELTQVTLHCMAIRHGVPVSNPSVSANIWCSRLTRAALSVTTSGIPEL